MWLLAGDAVCCVKPWGGGGGDLGGDAESALPFCEASVQEVEVCFDCVGYAV